MPSWLLKLLPYGAVALALGAAVWFIDHQGFVRAEEQAKAAEVQRKLDLADFERAVGRRVDLLETSMMVSIAQSDEALSRKLNDLEVVNKTIIQPTLTKEISREARFTDPTAGITDGMLRELNRARGLSQQRPCPPGSTAVACFGLPDAESDPRP